MFSLLFYYVIEDIVAFTVSAQKKNIEAHKFIFYTIILVKLFL
jgi:hypothetical protein